MAFPIPEPYVWDASFKVFVSIISSFFLYFLQLFQFLKFSITNRLRAVNRMFQIRTLTDNYGNYQDACFKMISGVSGTSGAIDVRFDDLRKSPKDAVGET